VASRSARLLRDRKFLPFVVAGGTSFAAPTATLVVLLWTLPHAYLGSSDPSAFGALALAFLGISSTVPTLLAAVVSGTLADRTDKRRLMAWVNAGALLATVGIAADLIARPGGSIGAPGAPGFFLPTWVLLLYPFWAIETTCVTLFRPAYNASLPRLVGRSDLGPANGVTYAVALLLSVGAGLSASALVGPIGSGAALAVPIGLFAGAGVGLGFLHGDFAPAAGATRRRFVTDASEGYRYLYRRTELLELTFGALAINFLSALAFVELGLYVQFWLALSNPIFVGLMISGGSLGAAVGTVAVNRLAFERRAGRLLWMLPVFQGLTIVGLGLVRTPWLAIPDMFLFGVFPGMFATVFFATVQATVPDDRLGRVLAADEVGSYALIPVGQATGGLLTVSTGIQVTYLTAGIGTVGVGLLLGAMPELRRLGFEPHDDAPPPAVLPSAPPGDQSPS
jgi:hypothetical protein